MNQVATSVLGFINDTMRPLLQGIQSATQALQSFLGQLRNLWEQVVWPISEINRAKALAQQLIATFRGLLNNLYSIGVNSAQLPNSAQLESAMRNHQVRRSRPTGVRLSTNLWRVLRPRLMSTRKKEISSMPTTLWRKTSS